MTKEDWELFVDKGVISKQLIFNIAYKIYLSTKLNDKEMSVYTSFSSDIEDVIRKIKLIENVATKKQNR